MSEEVGGPREDIDIWQDVVYGNRGGLALTFDLLQPKKRNGAAVLFFNSGGFYSPVFVRQDAADAGSRWLLIQVAQGDKTYDFGLRFSFADLLSQGFTVFDTRHGSSPQSTLDDIVEDCRRAVTFIRANSGEYGIDPDRIGAWGMSAGGYLATLAGTSPPGIRQEKEAFGQASSQVNAVVAFFPTGFDWAALTEVPEALPALQIDPAILDSLSLKHHISGHVAPTLIVYGEEDSDFITGPSEAIYSEMQEKGVESRLVVIPETGHLFLDKADHYNVRAGEQAMSQLLHWFQKHLIS